MNQGEKHCTCCVAWKHPISSELQGCENNELEAKTFTEGRDIIQERGKEM